MNALLKYEWKAGIKSLLIWSLAVGVMGMLCIVLYKSMEDSMAGVAESFASMGAFSDAMGMSTLSIATLKGYFATEIGTVHSLGSSLFAASILQNLPIPYRYPEKKWWQSSFCRL